MKTLRLPGMIISMLAICAQAMAAEPPLEPAVNTSTFPAPAAAPATAQPAATAAATPATPTPDKPAAASQAAPAAQPAASASSAARRAQDRLELDATQITGNSELPRVLYVVPWKRSDLGDLTGRPVNSLLDEVLTPVDRDVFQRQNRYYEALRPDTASSGSGRATPEGEK